MPHLVGLRRAGKQSYQLSYHTLRIAFNTKQDRYLHFLNQRQANYQVVSNAKHFMMANSMHVLAMYSNRCVGFVYSPICGAACSSFTDTSPQAELDARRTKISKNWITLG